MSSADPLPAVRPKREAVPAEGKRRHAPTVPVHDNDIHHQRCTQTAEDETHQVRGPGRDAGSAAVCCGHVPLRVEDVTSVLNELAPRMTAFVSPLQIAIP